MRSSRLSVLAAISSVLVADIELDAQGPDASKCDSTGEPRRGVMNVVSVRSRRTRSLSALLIGVTALTSACGGREAPLTESQLLERRTRITETPVSAIEVTGPDGVPSTMGSWLGDSLTVINAWAEWCIPCLQELPELAEFDKQWEGTGVALVGLTVSSKDPERLESTIVAAGLEYPTLLGGSLTWAMTELEIRGIPTTILVDATGRARRIVEGGVTADILNGLIAELNAEDGRGPWLPVDPRAEPEDAATES